MTNQLSRLGLYPIEVFDEQASPFVWTEVLLREINRHPDQVIVHLWPLEKTVILGMLDRQVPYLTAGLENIRLAGYQPVIRNLGGLAVVADEGVLNFSLFLPQSADEKLEITSAYHLMKELIEAMLADQQVTIEAYEVTDSYCPGNFDLSIKGKKFAGLAQRRIKDGIVVSIYLSVCGDQAKRGQLVADFYQAGLAGEETVISYPEVNPAAMANLSELCGVAFTVADMIDRLMRVLRQLGQSVSIYQPTPANYSDFDHFETLDREKQAVTGGQS
ncbi:lipoate--protein ligase family protein [Streptococcus sp. E17BB]|uniref:lipoate--protein ligase family protein n=1 Tax=Streptococcus sp. E17BB TaxID=3278714 RepID=UPI00359D62D0